MNISFKTIHWHLFVCALLSLSFGSCQPKTATKGVDMARIENLILFDRDVVVSYKQDVKRILHQRDSINLPTLGIQAYSFTWGGETGGPWNRILCFHRPSPNDFQCEFLYTGEYAMSLMGGQDNIIKSGAAHPLGAQLTEVGSALGDDVQMDKEKMKTLLVSVMEDLLGCSKVRSSFMDSLALKNLPLGRVGDLNFKYSKNKKFLETIAKVKHEMTTRPDPYVVFFHGELINGIWKGTVRQYDDKGRFGIDLEYLNGEFAYTIWL